MPKQNSKQPAFLPKSAAAHARNNAIINQVLNDYREGSEYYSYSESDIDRFTPEHRRVTLNKMLDDRIDLARGAHKFGGTYADEDAVSKSVAGTAINEIRKLIGTYPGGPAGFGKFNPYFESVSAEWSPSFYEPRDPESLPQRECFYGGHYYPKELVATVAPGGRGKSLLSHAESRR